MDTCYNYSCSANFRPDKKSCVFQKTDASDLKDMTHGSFADRDLTDKQKKRLFEECKYLILSVVHPERFPDKGTIPDCYVEKSVGTRNGFQYFVTERYYIDASLARTFDRIAKLTRTSWLVENKRIGSFDYLSVKFFATYEHLPKTLQ